MAIALNQFITYSNSVYDINSKFNSLERKNLDAKTKAYTVAKMIFASMSCGHASLNLLNEINKNSDLKFNSIYSKNEYVPMTHAIRDCIMDTDFNQIKKINEDIIKHAKGNKIFKKNKVDGLTVIAWDGVDLSETTKNIEGLPERERSTGITKYIKYECAMNIGERANIMVNSKQFLEVEKIKTKKDEERAKTIGETKAFEKMWDETEKIVGSVIDVHVFDALYLNQDVTNLINKAGRYFVIRLKDERRHIYKDAKGLFEGRKADYKYEIVEKKITSDTKYSKKAKKKDKVKIKYKKYKREITDCKLGKEIEIDSYTSKKKNSIVNVKITETVISRKEVWSDKFELTGYEGDVRVIRSLETHYRDGKEVKQELYVVTNMLKHDVESILKIMHLRWNIENCGFRKLKQNYNIEHVFIGEYNAINYIVQIIFMAFNLLELYVKIRLKEKIEETWEIIKRKFENAFHNDKIVKEVFKII